jgi:predicted aspartyl protease
VLHGPGGTHGTTWSAVALVDTGADYMHLPKQAAHAIGVSLAGATVVKIATAGGTITMERVTVDVEIEGIRRRVPVNFAPNAMPLIGRQAMFAFLTSTGFTTTEWLLE